MGRLIKIQDIEQFAEVVTLRDASITDQIIGNIRNLHEIDEIEKFMREILYDPNETPHGPTEIGDIVTTNVTIRGNPTLAAFVLKGRSFRRVSSSHVAHQFLRLRQLPELGLAVFAATGNIQDDAQRDFVQVALDMRCDYLILDAQDLAKLFLTYEKICPLDGLSFGADKLCTNGHAQGSGLTLHWRVNESAEYTIIKQSDVSFGGAKRYSANILLDRHYSKDTIREIIRNAVGKLKKSQYYRSPLVEEHWQESEAHEVSLYIYLSLEALTHRNWICRAQWIDNNLSPSNRVRLAQWSGSEATDGIVIDWQKEYKTLEQYYHQQTASKEEFLESVQNVLDQLIPLTQTIVENYKLYIDGQISESEFTSHIRDNADAIQELYRQGNNLPFPPFECKDYAQECQNVFAICANLLLPYEEFSMNIRAKQSRDWLFQNDVKRLNEHLHRLAFETSKLN